MRELGIILIFFLFVFSEFFFVKENVLLKRLVISKTKFCITALGSEYQVLL